MFSAEEVGLRTPTPQGNRWVIGRRVGDGGEGKGGRGSAEAGGGRLGVGKAAGGGGGWGGGGASARDNGTGAGAVYTTLEGAILSVGDARVAAGKLFSDVGTGGGSLGGVEPRDSAPEWRNGRYLR